MKVLKKIAKTVLFFFVSLVIGTSIVYIVTEKMEAKEQETKENN